ncbi:ricin-type beta-trefoil lectin domain protein [Kitasatospora viridis]|uniref:ricin-type beta-trefoil lectin domain protein n=1 Tax=Kitasatospora viridis TaxID=281105 RepID=UPI0031E2FB83
MLTTLAAGLAMAGPLSLTPAHAAEDSGQLIQNVEHGQCLTVEGSGFVNTITGSAQPYGVTTRPCTDKHKPWQTWNIDADAHRVHPTAYPDKCLQAVQDGRLMFLQTLPCDPDNTNQDFTFQNSQFRGEFVLVSGHTIQSNSAETYVGAYTSDSPGNSITLDRATDTPTPLQRWKTTPA